MDGVHTKIPATIHRASFTTAFGKVEAAAEEFKLTLELAHKLHYVSVHQCPTDNEEAEKIEDTYKKGLHKNPKFLALGLRSLIRRENGCIKFVLLYATT